MDLTKFKLFMIDDTRYTDERCFVNVESEVLHDYLSVFDMNVVVSESIWALAVVELPLDNFALAFPCAYITYTDFYRTYKLQPVIYLSEAYVKANGPVRHLMNALCERQGELFRNDIIHFSKLKDDFLFSIYVDTCKIILMQFKDNSWITHEIEGTLDIQRLFLLYNYPFHLWQEATVISNELFDLVTL